MALIKCPGCGNMISDKAIKCPKCGMPVTKYEEKPQHNHIANEAPVFSEREGSSNKWLYGIIALLLAAIAGCGYWWYSQNHSVEHLLASSETDSHQNEGTEGGAINDSGEISAKQVFQANGVSFTMIGVQGGTFRMGCSKREDSNADSDESPTHSVTLDSYYIGETEVTQELWEAVMDYNPSEFQYDNQLPVEFVSWEDCKEFIRRLNNITQKEFRFPSEAEWEYAARGGHRAISATYAGSNSISAVGWYKGNSNGITHPVKSKSPNTLGIYDMSGNLWEWCQDWQGPYSSSAANNPTGPDYGSSKILRGGAWNGGPKNCRLSNRDGRTTDYASNRLGLRLALTE